MGFELHFRQEGHFDEGAFFAASLRPIDLNRDRAWPLQIIIYTCVIRIENSTENLFELNPKLYIIHFSPKFVAPRILISAESLCGAMSSMPERKEKERDRYTDRE